MIVAVIERQTNIKPEGRSEGCHVHINGQPDYTSQTACTYACYLELNLLVITTLHSLEQDYCLC